MKSHRGFFYEESPEHYWNITSKNGMKIRLYAPSERHFKAKLDQMCDEYHFPVEPRVKVIPSEDQSSSTNVQQN